MLAWNDPYGCAIPLVGATPAGDDAASPLHDPKN